MKYLIFLSLLLSSVAQADYKLIVGGFSKHPFPMNSEKNYFVYGIVKNGQLVRSPHYIHRSAVSYNETHPAIGIESKGYELSAYLNSYDEISISAAKLKTLFKSHDVTYGTRLGIASGYEHETGSGFIPIAQFVISKQYEHITVDLGLSSVSTLIFKINL